MDKTIAIEEREAADGERTIELSLRFFTNVGAEKGKVIPKHAYAAGLVGLVPNETHGIDCRDPVFFHTPFDLLHAIEKLLVKNGITLHTPERMERYWQDDFAATEEASADRR